MHIDEILRTYRRGRFIAPIADLSALARCYVVRIKKLISIIMPRRIYLSISLMLLLVALSMLLAYPTLAFAGPKPKLTLNRQQGPLGVTLTLSGENFTPGPAALSYIDSHNTPGTFTPPGDSSVQVQIDGSFSTSNLVMPSSGPVGPWKIIVTDSTVRVWPVSYLCLRHPASRQQAYPAWLLTHQTHPVVTLLPSQAATGCRRAQP